MEKIQNSHFWPFQIYTSLFGKNCWKKFGTAIFGHSKLIPVFLGKIVGKIWNSHFWPFQIYTSLFGKNCWKKFRTAIFGHSKFIPVFLGKIVGKNSEQPFLAIPNLYQSVWEKLLEKISEQPFLAISNLYQSVWEKLLEKFRTAIFGHSKFIPVSLGKIVGKNYSEQPFLAIPNLYQSVWEKLLEKIWKSHFWPFQIYSSLFGKNCWKKLRTAIFGHSKFIPVSLGKIVGKN